MKRDVHGTCDSLQTVERGRKSHALMFFAGIPIVSLNNVHLRDLIVLEARVRVFGLSTKIQQCLNQVGLGGEQQPSDLDHHGSCDKSLCGCTVHRAKHPKLRGNLPEKETKQNKTTVYVVVLSLH